MAEVMSDVNSSNGKFEDDDGKNADAVKLNGVTDDNSTYEDGVHAEEDISTEQSLKNGCINRKHVRDTTTTTTTTTTAATKSVDHLAYDQTTMAATTTATAAVEANDLQPDHRRDSASQDEGGDTRLSTSSVPNQVRLVNIKAAFESCTVTSAISSATSITTSTVSSSFERSKDAEREKLTNGCLPCDPLEDSNDDDDDDGGDDDDDGGGGGEVDDAGGGGDDNDRGCSNAACGDGSGSENGTPADSEQVITALPSSGNTSKTENSLLDDNMVVDTSMSNSKLERSSNDESKDDVISVDSTPEKFKKNRKPSLSTANITPRRSSRNLNKQKSYSEKESAECENEDDGGGGGSGSGSSQRKRTREDDDIEEVTPTDPLADEPKTKIRNKTIVVSDTKGLVEFASNARASKTNKKEPTLVIIDTKSILSGRGPVPVSQSSANAPLLHSSSSGNVGGSGGGSAPIPVSLPIPAGALANATRGLPASTSAFSVIPIGLPAQGMYSQYRNNPPPQMKPIVVGPASTTVTPITIQSTSSLAAATKQQQLQQHHTQQSQQYHHQHHQQQQQQQQQQPHHQQQQPPVILPSLTDDMFVVEAPSFIVPYVYEKPPMKALKGHLEQMEIELKLIEKKEQEEQEEREREKQEKERERKEELEKERGETVQSLTAIPPAGNETVATTDTGAAPPESDVAQSATSAKVAGSSPSCDSQSVTEIDEKQQTVAIEESNSADAGLHMEVDDEVESSAAAAANGNAGDETDIVITCSKKPAASDSSLDSVKNENTAKGEETIIAAENKDRIDEMDEAVTTTTTTTTTIAADQKKETPSLTDTVSTPLKEDNKKSTATTNVPDDSKKPPLTYFDNPLGKFFMQIGLNLVQEHVQTDLLRSQKRKRDKEGENCPPEVRAAIEELSKTLESSKENNDPFKLDLKKCELCSFRTESLLVMAHHLETPHMKNYTYRCNFCPLEVRSPHDILFHMEAEHNIRGRLERAPAFHQCPNCPFEDNQKGKLTRHMVSCSKKYRPERNQEPPLDWEPPAKIPRVTRNRPPSMSPGNAVYQAAMSGLKQVPQNSLLPKLIPNSTTSVKQSMLNAASKRPNAVGAAAAAAAFVNRFPNAAAVAANQSNFQQRSISAQGATQGMFYRGTSPNSQTQVVLPQNYQLSNTQLYQNQNVKQTQQQQQGMATAKLLNQPSISITPLPRQTSNSPAANSANAAMSNLKTGKQVASNAANKSSFVVCEICDGYIKDLEQLRNHMQWIHKVKIHPKMIYNRPPLNCQKCQFRFFTDQGLERHLLGSHGLVTSSMQEAANKGKDGGRCPVCGRVYQWKLLNHVARDHQMSLKPAHLSYKCTVCTATFGMYKQFESHVYSAHSVVAKRAMDTKKPPAPPSSSTSSPSTATQSALSTSSSAVAAAAAAASSQNDAPLMRPLRINDEITIIPQPVRTGRQTNRTNVSSNPATVTSSVSGGKGKV